MTPGFAIRDTLWHAPRRLLTGVVLLYRWTLKPWLGNACRFEPSCSQYALDALRHHGALTGSGLTVWRLLRCHPWCDGGCDPVPTQRPRLFAHLGLTSPSAVAQAQPMASHRGVVVLPVADTVSRTDTDTDTDGALLPGRAGNTSSVHSSSKPPLP